MNNHISLYFTFPRSPQSWAKSNPSLERILFLRYDHSTLGSSYSTGHRFSLVVGSSYLLVGRTFKDVDSLDGGICWY